METINQIRSFFTLEVKNEISIVVKDFSYIAFPQILYYWYVSSDVNQFVIHFSQISQ